MKKDKLYDVAILGAGLGSTILGCVLARQGLKVVIIDKGVHPKFSVGESTVAETNLQMEILAARYDVPELNHLRSFHASLKVMHTNGIKTNFGFVYHRDGQRARLSEMNQVKATSALHLYRQDVDAYYFQVAIGYGCDILQYTDVQDIEFTEQEAQLKTPDGMIRSRLLVDGSGQVSLLGRKFGLRRKDPELRSHTRSLFTHMIMVKSYDAYVRTLGRKQDLPPEQFDRGTLHHVFPGGWLWIIPMNNNEWTTNPVCSVGLQLDPRMYPDEGLSAEEEFNRVISRWPDVAEQLSEARAIRPWVKTGRLQYSSRAFVGDRYVLLPHAATFIDPLFSRGLVSTTKGANLLAALILDAARANDFSAERFKPYEQACFFWEEEHDRLVHGAITSWANYDTWNAWFRVWHTYVLSQWSGAANKFMDYLDSGDSKDLWRAGADPELGYRDPRPMEMLRRASDIMLRVERDGLDINQATELLYEVLSHADFTLPLFPLMDRSARFQENPTLSGVLLIWRYVKNAPRLFRELYFSRTFGAQLALTRRLLGHQPSRFWTYFMPKALRRETQIRALPGRATPRLTAGT